MAHSQTVVPYFDVRSIRNGISVLGPRASTTVPVDAAEWDGTIPGCIDTIGEGGEGEGDDETTDHAVACLARIHFMKACMDPLYGCMQHAACDGQVAATGTRVLVLEYVHVYFDNIAIPSTGTRVYSSIRTYSSVSGTGTGTSTRPGSRDVDTCTGTGTVYVLLQY